MSDNYIYLAIVAFGLWLAILTWLVVRTNKYHGVILGDLKHADMARTIARYMNRVEVLAGGLESLKESLGQTDRKVLDCYQNVGFVKYDAFCDIGGELSSTIALLNDNGDGFIITTINGRNESRVYLKSVNGGTASTPLSGEEMQAVNKAIKGGG